ncbi:hypothetical protein [Tahibacter amnicola]|uniref:Uncharacterized protein n=1 Tax=Tahibacter amnicola TaxID=2976241 RepID=A0ABY6BNT9_9GAMM|nr:hypothetical protein [Tahibacter amnicola]UXI70060.1 hypothetical protein N4264_10665 [Tahibacter amnicola]
MAFLILLVPLSAFAWEQRACGLSAKEIASASVEAATEALLSSACAAYREPLVARLEELASTGKWADEAGSDPEQWREMEGVLALARLKVELLGGNLLRVRRQLDVVETLAQSGAMADMDGEDLRSLVSSVKGILDGTDRPEWRASLPGPDEEWIARPGKCGMGRWLKA